MLRISGLHFNQKEPKQGHHQGDGQERHHVLVIGEHHTVQEKTGSCIDVLESIQPQVDGLSVFGPINQHAVAKRDGVSRWIQEAFCLVKGCRVGIPSQNPILEQGYGGDCDFY